MDRPLSYWVAVAGMGFENDFNRLFEKTGLSQAELAARLECSPAYVSKILSGTGNLQLKTMAKWARAIGAILQICLIEEGKEVVRVVDYDVARAFDDERLSEPPSANTLITSTSGTVTHLNEFKSRRTSSKDSFKITSGSRDRVLQMEPMRH